MANSTKKKQTLRISLELASNPDPGEPIAKYHAVYSGDPVSFVYDVFDKELAEELDFVLTPAWIAEDVLCKFDDCDVDVTYDSSCHFLCDSDKCFVVALAFWGFEADDADVTYDSTCHFLCDSTKCLVPATPRSDCPEATH